MIVVGGALCAKHATFGRLIATDENAIGVQQVADGGALGQKLGIAQHLQ